MIERIKNATLATKIGLVLIVLAGIYASSHLGSEEKKVDDVAPSPRAVTLASVGDLSLETSPLPLLGTVISRSEANILAESSGKIVVYKRLGDYVGAGEKIAEFDNASERAALLSAEGAYDAAKAAQSIAKISRGSADQSLGEAKASALNAITSAYTTLDDAIRVKTDSVWRNPQTTNPTLSVTLSDSALAIALPQMRTGIEGTLRAREAKNASITESSDLLGELDTIESESQSAKKYLDDLSLAMSRAIADGSASQSTIDGYKASIALARTSISGLLASVSVSRNSLRAATNAAAIAEKNYADGTNGEVATADASVKSALGALQAAQARLEKTVVRSPIGGTVNSISVDSGDFVSPYTPIAVVGNNGSLEVVAYATEEDARALRVGGKVTIAERLSGVITRIAGALDPKTKKIEVRIGIENAGNLVNGSSVRIAAVRARAEGSGRPATIKIPLSALKITPTGSVVFTVSTSSTLVAHPVKEGTLLGDSVTIDEGITPDMVIITDARGHKDGETVVVSEKR